MDTCRNVPAAHAVHTATSGPSSVCDVAMPSAMPSGVPEAKTAARNAIRGPRSPPFRSAVPRAKAARPLCARIATETESSSGALRAVPTPMPSMVLWKLNAANKHNALGAETSWLPSTKVVPHACIAELRSASGSAPASAPEASRAPPAAGEAPAATDLHRLCHAADLSQQPPTLHVLEATPRPGHSRCGTHPKRQHQGRTGSEEQDPPFTAAGVPPSRRW
mmetsp:Transcript_2623/g.7324  ORF Transcript_2623/g.7324 Transcript_2623/m.7324 type:complete len:221 (+) Transcript_2623:237-899(+)